MQIIRLIVTVIFVIQCATIFAQDTRKVEATKTALPQTQDTKSDTQKSVEGTETTKTEPSAQQATEIQPKQSVFSFSAAVGAETITNQSFTKLSFMPELNIGKFGIGLDIAINLDEKGSILKRDWNDGEDYPPKIVYIRYGAKKEPVYFRIGTLDSVTLGHGTIMRRFSNMTFYPLVKKVGVIFDLNFKRFGFESMTDNAIDFDIIGGRMYYRPFGGFPLAIGVSVVVDLDPRNPTDTNKNIDRTASSKEKPKLAGADLDLPVVDLGSVFSLLLFSDYVKVLNNSAKEGYGITAGLTGKLIGFDYNGEYRNYAKKFGGTFFDSFYEVDRYSQRAGYTNNLTKLQTWEPLDKSQGFEFLLSREIAGYLAASLLFEEQVVEIATPDRIYRSYPNRIYISLKTLTKIFDKVSFGIGYERRSIKKFSDTFKLAPENSIASLSANYSMSEKVELIINYKKAFKLDSTGQLMKSETTSVETKMSF